MGVSQLLKELRPCLVDSHVKEYKGKTIAIDGNAFIFRGSYGCSEQVATGQPCTGPVEYVLKRIHMLKHFGVIPWVVLDGRRTPMKEETNNARKSEREKNLRIALDLKRQANNAPHPTRDELLEKAQSFFQKSIHVTRQMVTNTVEALKREGVKCTVAPYEADAQVAFLAKCGLASAVITEDSDILVYMAAVKSTVPLLYKMDGFGACKELAFDPLKLSTLPGTVGKFARGLSAFAGEGGGRLFVQLATLAGCDYVDNVKGLGLLTALPVIVKFKCIPADSRAKQILMHLQRKGRLIPQGHSDRMLRAELSFFWHRVYDPRSETCVHFCSAVPDLVDSAEVPALSLRPGGDEFLGEHIEDALIGDLADGRVDPVTGAPVAAELTMSSGGHRRPRSMPSKPGVLSPSGTPRKSSSVVIATPSANWESGPRLDWRQASVREHQRPARAGSYIARSPRREGTGLIGNMAVRASPKPQEKEGNHSVDESRRLQDVSEIVLAYGAIGQASALTPCGDRATKPVQQDQDSPAPPRAEARPIRSADAWSCLRQNVTSGGASSKRETLKSDEGGHAQAQAQAVPLEGVTRTHRSNETSGGGTGAPKATKRPVSDTREGRAGATSGRHRKKSRQAPAGRDGQTLFSFFGRVTKT